MRRGPPGPPPVRPRCAPAPRVAVRGWCAARIVAACAGLVAVEKCARLTTAAWGAERTLGARARVMVAVRWMGAADGEWLALRLLRPTLQILRLFAGSRDLLKDSRNP